MLLALREMRRAKLRFGLLIGAVGLLSFLILLISSLTGALITQFIGALRNQNADVVVYGEQARKNLEGSVVTPDQLAKVREVAGTGAKVGRLGEGTFTVTAKGDKKDAVIFGFDLDVSVGRPRSVADGRLPERDGEALASSANSSEGFGIGDVVRVEPDGEQITIVGLADDVNYSVAPTLFVSFPTYESARRTRNPDAREVYPSAVALAVENGTAASDLVARIDAAVPGVEPLTREQAVNGSPGVSSVRTSLDSVKYVTGLIVLIVTGFFFVILTVQKAQSLTLLRALGARSGSLVRALLAQVAIVVGGGLVVALVLLLAARAAFSGNAVGVAFDARSIATTIVVLLVLSMVASYGAIRRVLHIDPIRATQPGGIDG